MLIIAACVGAPDMYVMIRRYRLAGSSQELLRRIKEEFVPIITSLPGFKAYHVVDCGGLEAMSISFWETKVAARRSTEEAQKWISRSALGLIPFPPDKLEGDTVLDLSDQSAI
jgi:heme-degrading monooxygenase HmoA